MIELSRQNRLKRDANQDEETDEESLWDAKSRLLKKKNKR